MVKTEFKLKKAKKTRKLLKDKATVNFLFEHMKPAKINFSKIKIPSFINFLENEGNLSTNSTMFPEKKVSNETPILGLSLLNTFLEKGKQ